MAAAVAVTDTANPGGLGLGLQAGIHNDACPPTLPVTFCDLDPGNSRLTGISWITPDQDTCVGNARTSKLPANFYQCDQ